MERLPETTIRADVVTIPVRLTRAELSAILALANGQSVETVVRVLALAMVERAQSAAVRNGAPLV